MQLNNQLLLKNDCLINGQWVDNGSERIQVINPANGETVESVPSLSEEQINWAIRSAADAFAEWKFRIADERSSLMRKWHDLVLENELDLAQIMSDEQGKPVPEAVKEIRYAASFIEWFAEEAKRIEGDLLPSKSNNSRVFITKEPVGVCGLITPWNFPAAMLTRKLGPALAAGCTVVAKPAADTPLSALALGELAMMAGFPKGVINIVTGDAHTIGEIFTRSPLIRKISFTGSTRVGEILTANSVATHKRITMELGGNAPFIVFSDADLNEVTQAIMDAKIRNAGQTCISANRFLIQEKIAAQFIEAAKDKLSSLVVANAYEQGVQMGPLINEKAVKRIDNLVHDAVKNGAELVFGGKRSSLGPCFYEPTLLTGVTQEMKISQEEIFGPVIAVQTFVEESEALELANHTHAGLAAYFFTKNIETIFKFTRFLAFAMIGVNTGVLSYASIPFGGFKYSGQGKEGSKYGIDDYLNIKCTILSGL